jgi:hypothetical protein
MTQCQGRAITLMLQACNMLAVTTLQSLGTRSTKKHTLIENFRIIRLTIRQSVRGSTTTAFKAITLAFLTETELTSQLNITATNQVHSLAHKANLHDY